LRDHEIVDEIGQQHFPPVHTGESRHVPRFSMKSPHRPPVQQARQTLRGWRHLAPEEVEQPFDRRDRLTRHADKSVCRRPVQRQVDCAALNPGCHANLPPSKKAARHHAMSGCTVRWGLDKRSGGERFLPAANR